MARKRIPGNWMRVDTRIQENRKVLALCEERGGRDALLTWLFALGRAKERQTDGVIAPGSLGLILGAKPRHAELLVKHELWAIRPGGGWTIVNYDVWQDTAEEVDQARAAKARAGALSNCRRHHPQPCRNPACPGAGDNNVIPLTLDGAAHAN